MDAIPLNKTRMPKVEVSELIPKRSTRTMEVRET